eukprot:5240-Heterococcus_DN1.PRE.3
MSASKLVCDPGNIAADTICNEFGGGGGTQTCAGGKCTCPEGSFLAINDADTQLGSGLCRRKCLILQAS